MVDDPSFLPPPYNIFSTRCEVVGKVHHFHYERIECLDTKTINEEDLPFIYKCCRCGFEQEHQQTQIVSKKRETNLCVKCHKAPINGGMDPYCETCWDMEKHRQDQEMAAADSQMRAYHERRMKRIQKKVLNDK